MQLNRRQKCDYCHNKVNRDNIVSIKQYNSKKYHFCTNCIKNRNTQALMGRNPNGV